MSGFTSKVIALQFEWQWTYPKKSKRMRGVMEGRKWGGGVRGKVEVLYELLATQPWQSMPLQLRYAEEHGWGVHETVMKRSEKERKEWDKVQARLLDEEERKVERMKRHIYALPTHMPLTVGPFDELDTYAYRRMRRERRNGGVAGGLTGVTPGENGESDTEDGALDDDGAMVSGEESDNSGESDAEIIEQPEPDDDEWTSYPLTQPAHVNHTAVPSSSSSRPPSSSPSSHSALSRSLSTGQLRCGLCFRRSEVGEGGHGGFFSGCLQCSFVGHLTCIVQHIFKQMQMEESKASVQHNNDFGFGLTQPTTADQPLPSSAHSPPARSTSNPADLFTPSPAFPPTIFSPLPTSVPLLPPPATGTCPTCSCLLSYPLLIDRCRHLHVGRDGKQGGDVWYEEADELSMAMMVREYAGRAGEAKAKEKEEEAKKQKVKAVEKRKRKAKSATTSAGSGDESSYSTDTSQPGTKRKRKPATPKKKKAKATTTSPHSHPHTPPLSSPLSEFELDKENVGVLEERVAESVSKRKPSASRRVAMHDKSGAAPALFASSQPVPAPAVSSSAVSSRLALSLSGDDDVLLVDELPSADKRRLLMAAAAERRLGRSPTSDSRPSTHDAAQAAESDVSLLAVRGSGGLQITELSSEVAADRDYVQVDDDSDGAGDDVLALDTEAEDEVNGLSLSERLKARAASSQLVDSLLHDIR